METNSVGVGLDDAELGKKNSEITQQKRTFYSAKSVI